MNYKILFQRFLILCCFSFSLTSNAGKESSPCSSPLESKLYKKAKKAYGENQCKVAVPMLQEFILEHEGFLKENTSIFQSIDDAIEYCFSYERKLYDFIMLTVNCNLCSRDEALCCEQDSKPAMP